MTRYEYKVVPAPAKTGKAKGIKSPEARFARTVEDVLNEMAREGWEFQRAELLPSEERQGLTRSATTVWRNVLVFRRALAVQPLQTSPMAVPDHLPAAAAVATAAKAATGAHAGSDAIPQPAPEPAQVAEAETRPEPIAEHIPDPLPEPEPMPDPFVTLPPEETEQTWIEATASPAEEIDTVPETVPEPLPEPEPMPDPFATLPPEQAPEAWPETIPEPLPEPDHIADPIPEPWPEPETEAPSVAAHDPIPDPLPDPRPSDEQTIVASLGDDSDQVTASDIDWDAAALEAAIADATGQKAALQTEVPTDPVSPQDKPDPASSLSASLSARVAAIRAQRGED